MKRYLLPETGTFYKANLHCHSNLSDGKLSPAQIKKIYMDAGYSIVAYTDHDILIPHPELKEETFLPLNGLEIEVNEKDDGTPYKFIKTMHMCAIALEEENITAPCWHRSKYRFGNAPKSEHLVKFDDTLPDYERYYTGESVSDMMKTCREKGFFVTYNHPTWSMEDHTNYMGYHGMHAMEIINNISNTGTGIFEYNDRVYDDMLRAGKRIFCLATDDAHGKGGMCGGYIMIKAEKLEYKTVTDALMKGNFYSSEAPEIKSLYIEDGKVTITTSEAAEIRFNTGIRKSTRFIANNGEALTEATYELPPDRDPYYFRVTVTDKNGKLAYTNAYFTDELTEYLAPKQEI